MKKLLFILTTLLIASQIQISIAAPTSFTFTGKGFGHGVGLSQIGARAMALQGASAAEILTHYFPGTEVIPVPDNQTLRVNIGHQLTVSKLTIASKVGEVRLYAQADEDITDPPIILNDRKGSINLSMQGKLIVATVTSNGGSKSTNPAKELTIKWSPGTVVKVSPGGISYTFGQMQAKAYKSKIELTNSLLLHNEYLYGISEMPSSWTPAALQAQIITARTYASRKANNIRVECDCDLYGSIKDLNFVGIQKISEAKWGQQWKAAVDATAVDSENGEIISFNGMPISAFFFSSSAGITDSSKNAFGNGSPYLISVSDPGSQDPKLNPRFYKWERSISAEVIAKALGLPDVSTIEIISRNSTDSVGKIQGVSSGGIKAAIRGETFRSRTGLPSNWFYLN